MHYTARLDGLRHICCLAQRAIQLFAVHRLSHPLFNSLRIQHNHNGHQSGRRGVNEEKNNAIERLRPIQTQTRYRESVLPHLSNCCVSISNLSLSCFFCDINKFSNFFLNEIKFTKSQTLQTLQQMCHSFRSSLHLSKQLHWQSQLQDVHTNSHQRICRLTGRLRHRPHNFHCLIQQ